VHVFFSKTPVSISGYSLHPSSHCITVFFSTICCKELIYQREEIFRDIKEEARQHRFCPTMFVGGEPGTSLAMENFAGLVCLNAF